tara:strand:+ start:766 stop:1032 length:267 start_codon:yes stop_codon:yes gene_type:complete
MTQQFTSGDKVWFGSREFNSSAGRATYLFDQQTGVVDGATADTVTVTGVNSRTYTFTLRKNGEYVPQGQSQDPKGRNTLNLELAEETE